MTTQKTFYSVHPIDITKPEVKRDIIPEDKDLSSFVANLLDGIKKDEEKRCFTWLQETTEVRACLGRIAIDHSTFELASQTIAARLHRIEGQAQKKIDHMQSLQRG